ncbi:MAG: hypothetical protein JSU63_05765 [Phycisphaerales bacterium]|nr:MAG: hypothetical protein JSU63_05765 [Phycisphaerales bacterium]
MMSNTETKTRPVGQRKSRKLTVIVLAVMITGTAFGIAYRHYTNPEHIRVRAEEYLQSLTNGQVTVGSAGFSWFGGIRLFDVSVEGISPDRRATTVAGETSEVFSCRETLLTHDVMSALTGKLTIKSILAVEPTCVIARNARDGTTNLTDLWKPISAPSSPGDIDLPTIELRDARIRVVDRDRADSRTVEELVLTMRGRKSSASPQFYDVVWRGGGKHKAEGHSQIDVNTGSVRNVTGGLPWMSIEGVLIAVNAKYDQAGTWSDLLGLGGTVRASDYDFGGADEAAGRSATIELDNASLSIPISPEEEPLAPEDRYLRFEEVFGAIEVTAYGIKAEFDGTFHGARCHASATMHGGVNRLKTLDDVDFDVDVAITQLVLPRIDPDVPPAQIRFVQRWHSLKRFFAEFDPHGPVDLELSARKNAGFNEKLQVDRVVIDARGGDAMCRFFPYRVENLRGRVELTREEVTLQQLRGEHDGGLVTIEGRIIEPKRSCAADLRINGTGIPIDQALYDALPAVYKSVYDRFHPEGKVNVELSLSRTAGTDEEPSNWQTRSAVSFDGLSAQYTDFPLPVEQLSGLVVLEEDRLELVGIRGHSGDAEVAVEGTASFDSSRMRDLKVTVRGEGMTFDERLLAALSKPLREQVEAFHPDGQFNVETTLTYDDSAQTLQHVSEVALTGITMHHDRFPIVAKNVEGSLRVSPDGIVVAGITGQYNDATIAAHGKVDTSTAPPTTEFAINGQDVQLDDSLLSALPARLRGPLADWQINGPIDVDVTLRTDAGSEDDGLIAAVVAWLDGNTVRHAGLPLPLEGVRARINCDDSAITASGITARYGEAQVHVDVDARFGAGRKEGTYTISATTVTLDESIRGALSPGFRSTWDSLGLAGSGDLHIERLHYECLDVDESCVWSVVGRIDVREVSLPGVAEISGATGTLTGRGLLIDRLGGSALSGNLSLEAMDVYGQHIHEVQAPWSLAHTADGRGRLALDSIRGRIYGGALTAKAEVAYDHERTSYDLKTTVYNMDIQPYIAAARSPETEGDDSMDARGLADAHLYLSGLAGESSSRRGGGRIEIRDGHIYRLPLILAILNVINLQKPEEGAFQNAAADFHIIGNRMQLTDIELWGKVLALVGYGSMSLPDKGVNLYFVNVSPHRWARFPGLGDLVENASRELVELHATGPLSGPTVRAKPFRGLTEELKSLFQKREKKRIISNGS